MGSSTAKIECRFCKKMCTLEVLRKHHGKLAPKCIGERWSTWLEEKGWRSAGAYSALLAMIGVTKMIPWYAYYMVPVNGEGVEVEGYRSPGFSRWEHRDTVMFIRVAPRWAYDLAKKLASDPTLARRLGFTKKRELVAAGSNKAIKRAPCHVVELKASKRESGPEGLATVRQRQTSADASPGQDHEGRCEQRAGS